MRLYTKRFSALLMLGLFFLLAGCLDSAEQPILMKLSIKPASAETEVSQSVVLTAIGLDQNNNDMSVKPTWTLVGDFGSLAPTTGSSTTFTATSVGEAKVIAAVGEKKASIIIKITQTLASIEIKPVDVTLFEEGTQEFTAVMKDRFGNPMTTVTPIWSVTNEIGTITAVPNSMKATFTAAVISGEGPNMGTVAARNGAISAEVQVAVKKKPVATTIEITPATLTLKEKETGSFTAVVKDQYGTVMTNQTPTWAVPETIGTVNPVQGLKTTFTASTAGTGVLTATVGNAVGEAEITVTEIPVLRTLNITPANVQIMLGEQYVFTAVGLDQYDKPISVSPTWGVSDSVGSILGGSNGTATFTASTTTTGSGLVYANANGLNASAFVTVCEKASSITIEPDSITLSVGQTQIFTVTVQDKDENVLTMTPTWLVTNQIGSITTNSDGTITFTAEKAGMGGIIGTIGSVEPISSSAAITVNP